MQYIELGLCLASLASLSGRHREQILFYCRYFSEIFVTFARTSSNYLLTLSVCIHDKETGQNLEL